jgi:hypothetical protein
MNGALSFQILHARARQQRVASIRLMRAGARNNSAPDERSFDYVPPRMLTMLLPLNSRTGPPRSI